MRYFLASLGFVLLIVILIVILLHPSSKTATNGADKAIQLTSLAKNNSSQVRYTVEGPINAPEIHRTIQITITPNSRNFTILGGYQGDVIDSQTYDNNPDSYAAFLKALKTADFTHERSVGKGITEQSICPLNSRTQYQILDGAKYIMNLWSTTCAKGSFAGNIAQTRILFIVQIPNYSSLAGNVNVVGATSGNIF